MSGVGVTSWNGTLAPLLFEEPRGVEGGGQSILVMQTGWTFGPPLRTSLPNDPEGIKLGVEPGF